MTLPSPILSSDIPDGFVTSALFYAKAWTPFNSLLAWATGTTNVLTWTTPTLSAGFTASGTPFQTPGFTLDPFGWVHGRGLIVNSSGSTKAAGTTVFTLPTGYRPKAQRSFICDGTGSVYMRFDVHADGTVTNQAPSTGLVNAGFICLDGMHFQAEQ